MLIEQAILKELVGSSGITDLVGERIHYVKAPQDVEAPYIVFFKVSSPREHSHDGASGLARARFQFSCFADSYYEAKQIVIAIQSAIQAFSGIMGGAGGVNVEGCFYADETDLYEDKVAIYHIAVDFLLAYEE